MVDLSRPWPIGLDGRTWWQGALAVVALIGACTLIDHDASVWATVWPEPIRNALAQLTPFGESGWILIPAAVLYVATAVLAPFVRWRLMRTMLWQFAALYAFIFIGVGFPSLISTMVKRLVGRPRPMHFADSGLFGFRWNVVDWSYQSFPSGHATTAFALAACIGFVSPRWFYPALVLAAGIALSRLTGGFHYPSDIVAGMALGLSGAYAARWFFARRGWMFAIGTNGRIVARPLSSLRRYLELKRRGIAPKPPSGRP
jgi:undecaprenyl-diphosphatase